MNTEGARLIGGHRRGSSSTPFILVHGFGGSRHDWTPVIEALPPDLPIITYDQRGFGDSEPVKDSPFSHADDLVAVLDHLGLERADLCGVSLGGATVLGCALLTPHRVRSLALVSPMLAGWSWSPEWIELWKAIGRRARAGDIESARSLWWEHPLFASARKSPRCEDLRRSIAAFSGRQWVQDNQREEFPMLERLHGITQPTLLLTGEQDVFDFRLKADLIDASMPHVSRIDYPDAGHMLVIEKPTEIAGELASFLQSERSAKSDAT
ncbi:alpha/beta hydrolase [Novosphingobium sp. RD2P27]|uniref:Alpha/beta hydrolase n=1 Tax=Novosphingobium kalidii TaxID=3230299 RepID=A0ABV2CZY2_9SPHN